MRDSAKCKRCKNVFRKDGLKSEGHGHYICEACDETKADYKRTCHACRKLYPLNKVHKHESGKLYCRSCLGSQDASQKRFYTVHAYYCPDCGYKTTLKPCVACASKKKDDSLC